MTREEKINALYNFSVFLSDHPEVPIPYEIYMGFGEDPMEARDYGLSKQRILDVIPAFPNLKKEMDGENFHLLGEIVPGFVYKFHAYRESVCTRKVVGTRHVDEKIIPKKIIPGHDEEIYEWDCGSILKE